MCGKTIRRARKANSKPVLNWTRIERSLCGFRHPLLEPQRPQGSGPALKTAADLAPPRSPTPLRYADFLVKTERPQRARKFWKRSSANIPIICRLAFTLMRIALRRTPGW